MASSRGHRFAYTFDRRYGIPARLFGVTPDSAWVEVAGDRLVARFGPWLVETPLANVAAVNVTGPYSLPKTIGPAHLSLRDRGLTFATNPQRGACITFIEPVRGLDVLGLVRHPGLTVTVADPQALADAIVDARDEVIDLDQRREEEHARDRLHGLSASELRDLASEHGVDHAASMKKDELADLLERELGALLDEELPEEDPSRHGGTQGKDTT